MTASKESFDPDALKVGAHYRVDHRHERLRRTFRTDGAYLGVEEREGPDSTPMRILRFEVKPRFGKASVQEVDLATVVAITPR